MLKGMKRMSNYMGLIPTLMTSAPVAAAEEHHAEASAGLPQFDPTWWPSQIFWLALCFAFLYIVFSRKTLPQIGSILEARRTHIENDMRMAEELSAKAEKVKADYEQALKKSAADASATIKAVDDAAKEKLATALADFRTRYEAEITKTETRLQQSTATAMGDMDRIAAEIAADAAEKIAGIPADHTQAENVVRSLSQKAKAA